MKLAILLAALQAGTPTQRGERGTPPDTAPGFRPDAAALATAYADDATRELVRLAREHRGAFDASIFRYTATGRQRISLGVRALRRDRLIYRREMAMRIDWRRDDVSRVEVLGAREVVPLVMPGVRVPGGLESWARGFMPEPGDDRLFVAPTSDGFAWHPLVEGGEAVYRYAIGDTTLIRLPDGAVIRLVELQVTPRRRDIRLVTGSFWIEAENHGIVRAVFRPSRDFDLERDLPEIDPSEADDLDEVPALLKPIRLDVRYITVEYGLWEMRWWMPRLLALDASLQMGPARFPFGAEISFSDYTVEQDRWGLPALPPVILDLAGDRFGRPRTHSYRTAVVMADSVALIESPLLPPSIYAAGETLLSEAELSELGRRVGALPPPPWQVGRPRVTWPWTLGRGLLRYNRIEGPSVGARLDWDLARARLDLTGRLALATLGPDVELGAAAATLRREYRVAGYHRLDAMQPAARPLGIANSLNALVRGRDDGMYFRTTGLELTVRPAPGEPRHEARIYVERQSAVEVGTDFSLAHVIDPDHRFRPNIAADAADQAGVALRVGRDHGLDPVGFRWSAWLELTAETGTYDFAAPSITARISGPVGGPLLGGLELAVGTTAGVSPPQSFRYVGGPASVRGFDGATIGGPDHARARAELATAFPAVRPALFVDAGWAGRRAAWDREDTLVSAGVGVGFLDGLVRADLARAIQPTRQWRLHLYLDALL